MPDPTPSAPRLLLNFLLGSRDAILQIAASKHATLVSLILVLSAGLAREYDGENLIAEPWHALRPLAASTVTGTILFIIVHTVTGAWRWSANHAPGPADAYRRFMTCYWMTAPLAWFYAIPYERFLSPADAVRVNLWTLAIVAAWRVILITRVSAVLYGARSVPMFFIVMLFADAVAFAAFTLLPAPIIDFMGGVQHTERDRILSSVTLGMQMLTMLTAPVWILAALISIFYLHASPPKPPQATPIRAWRPLAIASIAIWIVPLAIAQPEQFRRTRVMQAFNYDDIPAALAELSRHPEHAFPRRWELPPRIGYGEDTPDLTEIARAIQSQPPAPWVIEQYTAKIDRELRRHLGYFTDPWPETLELVSISLEFLAADQSFGDRLDQLRITQTQLDQLIFLKAHDSTLTPEDHDAIAELISLLEFALANPSMTRLPQSDEPPALTPPIRRAPLTPPPP